MRTYGSINPNADIPNPSDTWGTIVISSAGAIVANDWPTGAQRVAFVGPINFWVNWASTKVNVPSTAQAGSTASSNMNELNPGVRNMSTALSTGYSILGETSGVIQAQFWRR